MEFIAEYTIKKKGFFGQFNNYVPGMLIKKGTKVVGHLYPDGEGKGTTPSVTINQITPTSAGVEEGMFFDKYNDEAYSYQFTYKFDINVTMRGADNISRWGVYEGNHMQSFDYNKESTKLRDGTYVLHCVLEILSNYNYDSRVDDLRLYPFYFSDEMTGREYHIGTTTHLFITPDGYYKIDDGPAHKI